MNGIGDKIHYWIRSWEKKGYCNGIPDEADLVLEQLGKVPSYRRICFAILKNDLCLVSLGFIRPKCKMYGIIKREELRQRGRKVNPEQLSFW